MCLAIVSPCLVQFWRFFLESQYHTWQFVNAPYVIEWRHQGLRQEFKYRRVLGRSCFEDKDVFHLEKYQAGLCYRFFFFFFRIDNNLCWVWNRKIQPPTPSKSSCGMEDNTDLNKQFSEVEPTDLPHCIFYGFSVDGQDSTTKALIWTKLNSQKRRNTARSVSVERPLGHSGLSTQGGGLHTALCVCLCVCLIAQSCLTLCDPLDCSPPGSSVCRNLPGKNIEVGCHAFLQGIFPTQGSNPDLLHCRQILYCLSQPQAKTNYSSQCGQMGWSGWCVARCHMMHKLKQCSDIH